MYVLLQMLSTMNLYNPIFLSHVVSTIFASAPPPLRFIVKQFILEGQNCHKDIRDCCSLYPCI